jgi:uncharacterized protein DUF1761
MYPLSELNYLAILVTAVVIFVIGALWYTVLFGKQWLAAHAYTPEQLEGMKQGMGRAYGLSFVCYLVLASVMSMLIFLLGIDNAAAGAKLGALCWLGFVATIGFTANLYSNKSFATYLIDASYQLVFMVVAGVLLAIW